MAAMGKKHPLDIFRSSADGFDTASRERRTVVGRVVASAPRVAAGDGEPARSPAPLPPGLPPAVAATRLRVSGEPVAPPQTPPAGLASRGDSGFERVAVPAGARPLSPPPVPMQVPAPVRPESPVRPEAQAGRVVDRPAPAPVAPRAVAPPRPAAAPRAPAPRTAPPRAPDAKDAGVARLLRMPASVNRALMLSACVLVGGLALWTMFASLGGGPALKSQVPAATPPGGQVFRVQAAAYPGTLAGQALAFSARDLLRQQGFPDVDVVAWPGSQPDTFARFDLVAGRAASEAALADVLARLKGLKNWPGSQKSPFRDALVAAFPAP
jgi:hypothetical protein